MGRAGGDILLFLREARAASGVSHAVRLVPRRTLLHCVLRAPRVGVCRSPAVVGGAAPRVVLAFVHGFRRRKADDGTRVLAVSLATVIVILLVAKSEGARKCTKVTATWYDRRGGPNIQHESLKEGHLDAERTQLHDPGTRWRHGPVDHLTVVAHGPIGGVR
jgi:hypothetical protein